ncbi:ThuA-like domain containing protein [Rhypophila sp. PSN 637]
MTESQTRTRTEGGFKVLVFSRTTPSGYRHDSIEAGIRGIKTLAEDVSRQSAAERKLVPFTVTATEDASVFDSATGLEQYRVIVLLSNSGDDCLDEGQLLNFRKWVEAGGGVVGVHCASFCCTGPGPGHEWYGDLLGGVFADHPVPQDGLVKVAPSSHPIHICGEIGTKRKDLKVGTSLRWHDEWYNFVSHPREKLLSSYKQGTTETFSVLLNVQESTYSGGKHGKDHPVAWCQEFKTGGGRCFYTSLGHFDEAYEDPWFMGHLLGGIYWAAKVI